MFLFAKSPIPGVFFQWCWNRGGSKSPPSYSRTESMTTTPQAFPAWWVAKVMSTPGDLCRQESMGASIWLAFVASKSSKNEKRKKHTRNIYIYIYFPIFLASAFHIFFTHHQLYPAHEKTTVAPAVLGLVAAGSWGLIFRDLADYSDI